MKVNQVAIMLLALVVMATCSFAQPVQVTLTLDKTKVQVGESTTLRVYAQIVSEQRAISDRIFGWYVDLLNTSSTVATLDAATLVRTTSDKDPRTSSGGTVEGPNIRGIYDTFINLQGAGKEAPVELFTVTVRAGAVGTTTFQVRAGSMVENMDVDFLVAPLSGGDPLIGGDYSSANIELEVTASMELPRLAIALGGTPTQREVSLTFPVTVGANHFVEYQEALNPSGNWQILPGSPHNSGQIVDPTGGGNRFYRLRIAAP